VALAAITDARPRGPGPRIATAIPARAPPTSSTQSTPFDITLNSDAAATLTSGDIGTRMASGARYRWVEKPPHNPGATSGERNP
jgi:hypothetical protein